MAGSSPEAPVDASEVPVDVLVSSTGVPPASSLPARQSTNCPSSLSETSCMTPRPNWAGLPVTLRSVTTRTRVSEPSGSMVIVTVAPAVPLPRLSLPLASMTARCPASSRSTKDPLPLYTKAIGPSLTLHVPSKESPSTEVTVAPGKHSATPSMSIIVAQAVSTGAFTVNECSRSMAHTPAAARTARRVSTPARCCR